MERRPHTDMGEIIIGEERNVKDTTEWHLRTDNTRNLTTGQEWGMNPTMEMHPRSETLNTADLTGKVDTRSMEDIKADF